MVELGFEVLHLGPIELSAVKETHSICAIQMVDTSHMWPLNTGNVANRTGKLNFFLFYVHFII